MNILSVLLQFTKSNLFTKSLQIDPQQTTKYTLYRLKIAQNLFKLINKKSQNLPYFTTKFIGTLKEE